MDNFNDMHRKASDDYNNGTIDEKMCPMCGTILPGNVKFCTECGQNLSGKIKKDSSPSTVIIIATAVIIAIVTGIFGMVFLLQDTLKTDNEFLESNISESSFISDSSVVSETLSSATEPEKNYGKGHYEAGVYKIGEDIPKGTYMLISTDGEFTDIHADAYYGLYSDSFCTEIIDGKWFDSSAIVNLETDDYIEFTWCEAIALDVLEVENSPFEHSGMFRCGFDFEPGTYKLVPTTDQGYQMYYVHDNINAIDDKIIYTEGHHGFSEGTEVTVKEGEILELSWCILEKNR